MNIFIWTECLGCPLIGKVSINSFLKFHDSHKLNVFVFKEDIKSLPKNKRIIYHIIKKNSFFKSLKYRFLYNFKKTYTLDANNLKTYFKKGHKGTAELWAYILKKFGTYDAMIHFDSDVIFCNSAIDLLIKESNNYDLIGQCRPYKNNSNNDYVRELPDLVATCCFLFKPSLAPSIKRIKQKDLRLAIQGRRRLTGKKLLDFFDQISHEILLNNGKIKFISVDKFGGTSKEGSRKSNFSNLNDMNTKYKMDIGSMLVHFSAVGSGYNIWKNKARSGSRTYDTYALDRFYLFMKCFYPKEELNTKTRSEYKPLIDYFHKTFINL